MRLYLPILLFFLIVTSIWAGTSDKYVLQNPSFETESPDGSPNGWETNPKFYSPTFDIARTGNASLHWRDYNSDYTFCSQKTNLKSGDTVDFSVWVKTRDLKKGFASICLEWKNKDGLNEGSYTNSQVTGTTQDWIKIGGIAIIPPGAQTVYIRCFATDGATGTIWFDDAELRRPEYKLYSGITSDHYRHYVVSDLLTIKVGVCPPTEGFDINKLDARLSLVKYSSDKEIVFKDLKPDSCGKNRFQFKIDASLLVAGKYRVICSAVNPENGKKEDISLIMTKWDQMPKYRSYVDRNLRLILDGKPFFPLGLYIITPAEKDIDRIESAGFNCLLPYALVNKKTLDYIDSKNLKVIYNVQGKIPGSPESEKNASFEKLISELKQHRSIIAWYINDEVPLARLSELIYRRDLLEKLDPERPTLTVLCQLNEIGYYLQSLDIVGTDPYPIPKKPAFMAAEWTRLTGEGSMNCHAVWQVPQMFNWAAHRGDPKMKKIYRAPTYNEMRGMAWMCIANGANGLLFYSYHSLQHLDKTIDEGGQALVREPFDDRWKDVTQMAGEIRKWIPVLLQKPSPIEVKQNSKNNHQILFRLYGTEKETHLLIVNGSPDNQVSDFMVPKDVMVQTSDLPPETFLQKENMVSITLKGFQPCFLRLVRK